MTGVSDFTIDAQGDAILCVTQDGVVSFGITTGAVTTVYAGQAASGRASGEALIVRTEGPLCG